MPNIVIDGDVVHYEVVGSGPPVILIHGWTQAWNTWRSTIERFQHRYRMYAPDLWGFGESAKENDARFRVPAFVEMIPQFMDALGIGRVPIMGHSMGGTTALGVALDHPERVEKVAVVGAPVDGRSLSVFLKLAGRRLVASAMLAGENYPGLRSFLRMWSPFVSRRNPDLFYEMTVQNAAGFTTDSFSGSISSLHTTNYTTRLHELAMPAMAIYGMQDVVVNPGQIELFRQHLPAAHTVAVPDAGHFVMWDNPTEFNRAFEQFMSL